ncbi:hypothetical protein [Pantoea sp. A4]|uniref:hypothetical protein n=1 Tax=Pantoea sp. A4 TaxID=1225184 RepID=UPI0003827E1C|nr:hypothetical protein [Pantoea sp. A4]
MGKAHLLPNPRNSKTGFQPDKNAMTAHFCYAMKDFPRQIAMRQSQALQEKQTNRLFRGFTYTIMIFVAIHVYQSALKAQKNAK